MSLAIIDSGGANIASLRFALDRLGAASLLTQDPAIIRSAPRVILPGVGAFGDAMSEITRRDLANPIRDFIASDRPFLGICLGLQLLFERSFENGEHDGLGILKGDVVRFEIPQNYKVPHMGWNTVSKKQQSPLLKTVDDGTHFYFVHSFYVRPSEPSVVALECEYGTSFCAMVQQRNLYATQFHPEKSQSDGLKLLKQFDGLI